MSANAKQPTVLILADFKKAGVKEAVAVAEEHLNGHARIVRKDLMQRKVDEKVRASWALVLGGDGAILAAARRVARAGIPILGVNLGKLGFLAEINPDAIGLTIDKLLKTNPRPVERMMINAEIRRGNRVIGSYAALNDVVISRAEIPRMVRFSLFINREKVNTFTADGIIVSTPTGSTAYSLATGGPIIAPETSAIVISSICPHSFTNRPIVIDSRAVADIEPWSSDSPFALNVDGQVVVPMRNGDRVRIRRNKWPVRLIKISGRSFFETLRAKLNWEGSKLNVKS